jgi:hypothetical protein
MSGWAREGAISDTGYIHVVKWYKARLEADPDADVRIIPVGD